MNKVFFYKMKEKMHIMTPIKVFLYNLDNVELA